MYRNSFRLGNGLKHSVRVTGVKTPSFIASAFDPIYRLQRAQFSKKSTKDEEKDKRPTSTHFNIYHYSESLQEIVGQEEGNTQEAMKKLWDRLKASKKVEGKAEYEIEDEDLRNLFGKTTIKSTEVMQVLFRNMTRDADERKYTRQELAEMYGDKYENWFEKQEKKKN